MEALTIALLAAGAWLLGSVPFALLLVRWRLGIDLRTIGSGNIGANNVLRTGRKDLAAATLLLDGAKGALPVAAARALAPDFPWGVETVGAAAFLGHLYPAWLRFRGGKGVATGGGVLLAYEPWLGLSLVGVWCATVAAFRISSLGALAAAAAGILLVAVSADALFGPEARALVVGVSLLVFWRHRSNIRRLLANEEPRIGESEDAGGAPGAPGAGGAGE